jgi:uncharacterized protein YkwD
MPHARARTSPSPRAAAFATATAAVLGVLLTPQSAAALTVTEARTEMVKLVNSARANAGCAAVKINTYLNSAAQAHATDMSVNKYFSHTSKDGTTWSARIKKHGYAYPGGENIAYGYSTPAGVMKAWMASDGHRKNIVNCKFKVIGVGWAAGGNYWVQDFGY